MVLPSLSAMQKFAARDRSAGEGPLLNHVCCDHCAFLLWLTLSDEVRPRLWYLNSQKAIRTDGLCGVPHTPALLQMEWSRRGESACDYLMTGTFGVFSLRCSTELLSYVDSLWSVVRALQGEVHGQDLVLI